MADLGELKRRIISETLRDDLADDMKLDLDLLIQKSIDEYAARRWWFNEKAADAPMVIGSPFADLPPDFRYGDSLNLHIGGIGYGLTLRDVGDIDSRYLAGPINGQPTEYAVLQTSFYLWPAPSDDTWRLVTRYVADVSPALDYALDASSNVWTNEGSDLVVARVKLRLYRDYLSVMATDPRIANATAQEADAYSRLRSEHNRRLTTNKVKAGW
jgi:hypothetical protein